jgi:iron-sulfur cluster insertion protein
MSEAAFSTQIVDSELKLSATAAEQIKGLMQNAEDGIEGIRVFVTGGGCGGMTYGMTYTDTIQPYDKVLEGEGYKLLVDAVAMGYLKGCDIDFVDNGLNASFVFNNVFKSVGGSGACGGCGASGGGCA